MKKIILLFSIIISINCECTFNSDNSINNPIYLQKLDNDLVILPIVEGPVIFEENNEIIAFCPSGFKTIGYDGNERRYNNNNNNNNNLYDNVALFLKCINNKTKIKDGNNFRELDMLLNCKNSIISGIYDNSLTQICDKKYYTVGLNIQQLPIVFADICFDLENMRLSFVHYIAQAQLTPALSVSQNFNLSKQVNVPAPSFFIDELSAHKLIKKIIGNQSDVVTFKYEELCPSDNLSPYIFEPLQIAKRLNRFLGWTSFTQGNWKSFRNLLKSRSKEVTYDVYLGTSDVIVAPTNDECKSFKSLDLEEYFKTVSVPKYVWAYLKSKENQTDEFVVIGVNSPYFEFFPRNETIFCDDICHEIDWFAPMDMFRKITTFGYMFCCRKEQVEKRLDGFPIFNVNKATTNATTKPIPIFSLLNLTGKVEDEKFDVTTDNKVNDDVGEEDDYEEE